MEEHELKITFTSYDEMNKRFSDQLLRFQTQFNKSNTQLIFIGQIIILREEQERIVFKYKDRISDLGSTLNEALERLKKENHIHVMMDDIPTLMPQSKFKDSGVQNTDADNLLISQILSIQSDVIKNLSNYWFTEKHLIDHLNEKYEELNSRLIKKISNPYFRLLQQVIDLGRRVQFILQDIEVINFVLEKIIEEGNYISNEGRLELTKDAPIGMKGMSDYVKKLKEEGNSIVKHAKGETLTDRYVRVKAHLMEKFPNEANYPKQSTIRNVNWLNEK